MSKKCIANIEIANAKGEWKVVKSLIDSGAECSIVPTGHYLLKNKTIERTSISLQGLSGHQDAVGETSFEVRTGKDAEEHSAKFIIVENQNLPIIVSYPLICQMGLLIHPDGVYGPDGLLLTNSSVRDILINYDMILTNKESKENKWVDAEFNTNAVIDEVGECLKEINPEQISVGVPEKKG